MELSSIIALATTVFCVFKITSGLKIFLEVGPRGALNMFLPSILLFPDCRTFREIVNHAN